MNKYFKIGFGLVALTATGYFIYKLLNKRKISSKGISFITDLEGKRNYAYRDSKGLWTTGVGHLIKPNEEFLKTKVLSNEEINNLLRKDLSKFESVVNDSIDVPLKQHEFDSLVSIAFNIGENAFPKSTFVKLINEGKGKEEIKKSIAQWKKPIDIIGRRAKEIRLFDNGLYSNQIATRELTYFI